MSESSVKVAVRVRPFNQREIQEGAKLCIEMNGQMTRVYDASNNYEKEFFFDYSYWSHDGFVEDHETGYSRKTGPSSNYADQMSVFNDLGVDVLNNAWEGYHTCLFAYGQTGSGKSYSMVGYGANKGIIPIACEEIFNRINAAGNQYVDYTVSVGILEIYNEQIQDLLQPPMQRVKGGLKIREHPKTGVYVDGLLKVEVKSYDEISEQLDIGSKHRTVAATQMNATSSRAHTVLTISFTQIFYDENTGKPLNRKQSDINLVDLAGSERASKTGATGERLQEGSNINKSLSTLGKVITALAKRSSGQLGRGEVIPYRESKLTRILQNALGGNSKTTMIAAISPATFNLEETVSTLRYADAVKAIKNQAIINETPQEKLIRELKEENERLKAMLEGKVLPDANSVGGGAIDENLKLQYERQIEELMRAKQEAEKTMQEKMIGHVRTGVRTSTVFNQQKGQLGIHLSNLNEDPLLSGYIKHPIRPGINKVGKKSSDESVQIIVDGLGIGQNHCEIHMDDDSVIIIPNRDSSFKTIVNGKLLVEPLELEHGDRIRFGNHNYWLFIDPEEIGAELKDWQFAMNEANEEEVKGLIGVQDEKLKKKEEEMRIKLQKEFEDNQRMLEEERQKIQTELQTKANEDTATQKVLLEKEQELRERQRKMEEEMRRKEQKLRQHEANRKALDNLKQELSKAIQEINEANERAVLLGKNVVFRPELYRTEAGAGEIGGGMQQTGVRIKVLYPEISEDIQINWSLEKLNERLIDMQELSNQLHYSGQVTYDEVGYDPFSDEIDQVTTTIRKIGNCYVYLDTLYYLIGTDEDFVPVIDESGSAQGSVMIEVSPIIFGINLEDFDNLKEIGDRQIKIQVKIVKAVGLPERYSNNVYCTYKLGFLGDETFKTAVNEGFNQNPVFNYQVTHDVYVDILKAEEFLNHALSIAVYGDLSEDVRKREMQKLKEKAVEHSHMPDHAQSLLYDQEENDMILQQLQQTKITFGNSSMSQLSPIKKRTGEHGDFTRSMNAIPEFSQEYEVMRLEINEKDHVIELMKSEQMRQKQEYDRLIDDLRQKERKLEEERDKLAMNRSKSCTCQTFQIIQNQQAIFFPYISPQKK